MDYFEAKKILGVEFTTEEEVNRAFREKCRTAHPDLGGDPAEFIRICDARTFLLASTKVVVKDVKSETRFKEELVRQLQSEGALTFKVHGHAMQASGWPDLQVYSRVWTGHLELKVGSESASPLQKRIIDQLRIRGTRAWVLRYVRGTVSIDGRPERKPWPSGEMLQWLSRVV